MTSKIVVKNTEIKDYFPNIKISNLVKTLLFNLGLDEKQAYEFLNIDKSELESPFKIFGIKKAAKIIEKYIFEKKKIIIHGDFDVDGVCASTILWEYLYFVRKADAFPIIPKRVDEGYGLSEKTVQKAIDMGGDLIITVDCGIKDVEIVEKYKEKIDFLITDHHQFLTNENQEIILPKAKAVVHSSHPKSKFSTPISGAATAWQLVRAMELLRKKNLKANIKNSHNDLYTNKSSESVIKKENFDINNSLDLVAISTVCDIIPMTTENRKLVLRGIKILSKNNRLGLKELMKVSSVSSENVNTYHFGFVLGPRLNAPGRVVNDAIYSMRLLSTRNPSQACELAKRLDELNAKRQELTSKYLNIAEKQINLNKIAFVITGHKWPEGILGLIASKLAEKYYRPVFVASIDENGKITGSSRSPIESFHLNKALEYAKDHLTRFGGHKMAAGFASEKRIFDGFEERIIEFIKWTTKEEDFIKKLEADLEIPDFNLITPESVMDLKKLEPYGIGNPRPKFLFRNCQIISIQEFGKTQEHLRLTLSHNSSIIAAKGFNCVEKFPGLKINEIIDLIGYLTLNNWNNNMTVEVDIVDIQK